MELPELSSRSPSGAECLGHEGTLKLQESWKEILRERRVRDDDEIRNNTITVSVGPQFEADIASVLIFLYIKNIVTFSSDFMFLDLDISVIRR